MNMTEQRDALFRESEELRSFDSNIVESINDGILLEDASGHITYVNPAMARMLDSPAEDLIGQHSSTIVAPEAGEQVANETARRAEGPGSQYETDLLTSKGTRVPTIVSSRALFVGAEFAGVLSAFTDITERRRAEERLRKSEETARAILNATVESVALLDAQGTIVDLNETAAQRLGKARHDLIGIGLRDAVSQGILSPELYESRWATIREVVASGKPTRDEDQRSGRIMDTSYYPVLDEDGNAYGVAVFSRDITKQRRAEHESRLADRLATIGRLTAALTHEINYPLQAVQTNLELLADFDLEPEERRSRLSNSLSQVERLAAVTRQVLEFSVPGGDSRAEQSAGHIVEDAWTLMREHVRRAGIEAQIDVPQDPPTVFASPIALAQVLVNLIGNSVEAMPEGGHLRVRVNEEAGSAVIEVANDGPHLAADELSHIFDAFYTTKPGHAGIGLWTTQRIVEEHDGTISVANRDDGPGVLFTIRLPLARVSESANQRSEVAPE